MGWGSDVQVHINKKKKVLILFLLHKIFGESHDPFQIKCVVYTFESRIQYA
jgi:hypothetical protein